LQIRKEFKILQKVIARLPGLVGDVQLRQTSKEAICNEFDPLPNISNFPTPFRVERHLASPSLIPSHLNASFGNPGLMPGLLFDPALGPRLLALGQDGTRSRPSAQARNEKR
jgi:hypothetical protein